MRRKDGDRDAAVASIVDWMLMPCSLADGVYSIYLYTALEASYSTVNQTGHEIREDDVPREGSAVGVDLGKTSCRIRVRDEVVVGEGLAGLGADGSAARSAARIGELLDGREPEGFALIGIGAAGAFAAPGAAARLAALVAARYDVAAAVASDVVTAHIGAFGGGPGVCLIVGTGAVALAVSPDGRSSMRDGRGLVAGDWGSGSWIGREGLRAAEAAQVRVGPPTTLLDRIADPRTAADAAVAHPDAAAKLAAYAPAVLACAAEGDEVAVDVVDRAVAHVAQTAAAAAGDVDVADVSLVGGVTADAGFRERLRTVLVARGLRVAPAQGNALDGALIMVQRTDLPLEGSIHRA
jgi:N-acetylglucosamine kinase-like BadF-type ATPase